MSTFSKLTYEEIKNLENIVIVDVRLQKKFQNGHFKGSINLNPKNLVKYGSTLLNAEATIILVTSIEAEEEILALKEAVQEVLTNHILGYLTIEEVAQELLVTSPMISVEELMTDASDYVLLDVRDPATITRPAPEKNLLNIPIATLENNLEKLDPKRPIYTLCGSGNSATSAASYLKKLGYETRVVEGGIGAVERFNEEKRNLNG